MEKEQTIQQIIEMLAEIKTERKPYLARIEAKMDANKESYPI
jgi:hypothetical protein